ncbi:MAG: HlyD family secretion protein [Anaeromassilibacillus sp.]
MEVGDTVNSGDKLVDLYNDRTMVLKVPFLNTDANQISAGDAAQVQILETYETVNGTVTAVSSMEQTLSGGSVVRMVTIEVGNPGGISTSSTAAATVNGLRAAATGRSPQSWKRCPPDHGGEIASMAVEEGSYVHEGATLFTYTQESADVRLKRSRIPRKRRNRAQKMPRANWRIRRIVWWTMRSRDFRPSDCQKYKSRRYAQQRRRQQHGDGDHTICRRSPLTCMWMSLTSSMWRSGRRWKSQWMRLKGRPSPGR